MGEISVHEQPLKSKLDYWRSVFEACDRLNLFDDEENCLFDEHISINLLNERLAVIEDTICELDGLHVEGYDGWLGDQWGNDEYDLGDDDDHSVTIADGNTIEEVIEHHKCIVYSKIACYEDEKSQVEDEVNDLRQRLKLLQLDAIEAVRFLLCGGEFIPIF